LQRKALTPLWLLALMAPWTMASCSPPYETGLARGKQEYRTCVPCHGDNGAGNREVGAPAIAGLPAWYVASELGKFQNGVRGAHPQDAEGARMRPMARTLYRAGDLEAVAAYVARLPAVTLPATIAGADTAAGRASYAICTTCHGPEARGNRDLFAPPIAQQADWYMVAQLEKFRSGMRGAHPDDTTGAQMRAMSMTLADSSAVRDVVAFIRSLAH
jgi:cytochrome c oxidase subunit 2